MPSTANGTGSGGGNMSMPQTAVIEDPILAFTADAEINQLQWCKSHEDWVAISFLNSFSILKV
jgi:hypothetical protein